jgi:hypothetical protein
LNSSSVRAGRTNRVGGGRDRVSGSGRDRGERNRRRRSSSLVMAAREVAISSGEKYPESGMFQRLSETSRWADKSSFGIDGNGILFNLSLRRRGADPPKNDSGRTGTTSFIQTSTSRCVSSGNGFCIASVNLCHRPCDELPIPIFISQMRLECSDSSTTIVFWLCSRKKSDIP